MRAMIIRTLLAVTLAAGAMALLPAEEAVGERPSGRYGFSVQIERDAETSLAICDVEIVDLQSKTVLCNPRLSAPEGELTTATTTISSGGIECDLTVSIEVEQNYVAYVFEAEHNGSLVSSQQGTLKL
ncbi:MAG: hypothetical protein GY906_27215 [bacterium]|nr:hypothetical protein [bacterium]